MKKFCCVLIILLANIDQAHSKDKFCELCTIPEGWQSASGDFLTYKFDAENIVHKITWSTEYVLLTDSCGKQWIKRKILEK